ncbi:hypothetical protein F909_02001 [Acinetobacter sp. ANC 3929]|uniref:hypothetical protein n=1 Tax=Acinetobacter sp. ANC 3929 TaxID=1217707 RepID=UPI0002CE9629|nr:hypothetical protein F909_02001 [Acinetobacter sp. ANC 3929]
MFKKSEIYNKKSVLICLAAAFTILYWLPVSQLQACPMVFGIIEKFMPKWLEKRVNHVARRLLPKAYAQIDTNT